VIVRFLNIGGGIVDQHCLILSLHKIVNVYAKQKFCNF